MQLLREAINRVQKGHRMYLTVSLGNVQRCGMGRNRHCHPVEAILRLSSIHSTRPSWRSSITMAISLHFSTASAYTHACSMSGENTRQYMMHNNRFHAGGVVGRKWFVKLVAPDSHDAIPTCWENTSLILVGEFPRRYLGGNLGGPGTDGKYPHSSRYVPGTAEGGTNNCK